MTTPTDPVSLAGWRRSVAELYADVRAIAAEDPRRAAAVFRERRDEMYRNHTDTPLPAARRAGWRGMWFPYEPAWRVLGSVEPIDDRSSFEIPLAADGVIRCARIAKIAFTVRGSAANLILYWLEGYGGGLWLPFADAGNGGATYGGGRYLYDTIKGADLGASATNFVLDFNFAYNPSCAYDDRWSCPLAPPENRLPFDVPVGERMPEALPAD